MPKADFPEVYRRLKAIIEPYRSEMNIVQDNDEWYLVHTKQVTADGKPVYFGGVRLGKAYVSYYLMPVYTHPELLANISPELKKRMQGKSCFNLRSVDESLLEELSSLTRAGAERYREAGLL